MYHSSTLYHVLHFHLHYQCIYYALMTYSGVFYLTAVAVMKVYFQRAEINSIWVYVHGESINTCVYITLIVGIICLFSGKNHTYLIIIHVCSVCQNYTA